VLDEASPSPLGLPFQLPRSTAGSSRLSAEDLQALTSRSRDHFFQRVRMTRFH
jgi:hypothetical protein